MQQVWPHRRQCICNAKTYATSIFAKFGLGTAVVDEVVKNVPVPELVKEQQQQPRMLGQNVADAFKNATAAIGTNTMDAVKTLRHSLDTNTTMNVVKNAIDTTQEQQQQQAMLELERL